MTAFSLAFDTVVELRSPTGETLAFNDDHGDGTDSRVTTKLPIDGLYGFEVRSWMEAGGGSYKVAVHVLQQEEAPGPTGNPLEEGGAESDPEAARSIDNLDLLRYVPQEVEGLVFADIRGVVGSGGLPQWLLANREVFAALRDLEDEVGVDLEELDHALVAGDEAAAIAIVRGRLDHQRLEALAHKHGYVAVVHREKQLFEANDKAIAVLEPGVVALGSASLVRRALAEPATGDGVDSNRGLLELLRHVDPRSTVWGVAWPDDPVDQVAAVVFGIRLDNGLRGALTAVSTTDIGGALLLVQLRSLLAVAGRAAHLDVHRNLIDSFEVTGEGTVATLHFELPASLLTRLLATSPNPWLEALGLDGAGDPDPWALDGIPAF